MAIINTGTTGTTGGQLLVSSGTGTTWATQTIGTGTTNSAFVTVDISGDVKIQHDVIMNEVSLEYRLNRLEKMLKLLPPLRVDKYLHDKYSELQQAHVDYLKLENVYINDQTSANKDQVQNVYDTYLRLEGKYQSWDNMKKDV